MMMNPLFSKNETIEIGEFRDFITYTEELCLTDQIIEFSNNFEIQKHETISISSLEFKQSKFEELKPKLKRSFQKLEIDIKDKLKLSSFVDKVFDRFQLKIQSHEREKTSFLVNNDFNQKRMI